MPSRYSPGVQPISPLEVFSQAGHAFMDERERKRDRQRQDEEDERRRMHEDEAAEFRRIQEEVFMRDAFGGVPVDPAAAGSAFSQERGRHSARNAPAAPGADIHAPGGSIFEGEQPGLAAGTGGATGGARSGARGGGDRRSALEREDVALLPGQFAGGQFQPTAVPVPRRAPQTRTVGDRTYALDPTQTADARAQAREQEQFDRTVADLVAAGHDPMDARAIARGHQPAPDEPEGFDPDRPGTFGTQEEYLAFQEALADARATAGGRGGGAPRANFTEEDLRAAGVPEGLIAAALEDPLLARQIMAAIAREGRQLSMEELLGMEDEEAGPVARNQPGFRNWLARVLPGGQAGRDEFDVDQMIGVIEGLSDADAREFLRSERFGADEIARVLERRRQTDEPGAGPAR